MSYRKPKERSAALDDFRSGAARFLVACPVTARGLDVRHVAYIVKFGDGFPDGASQYVRQAVTAAGEGQGKKQAGKKVSFGGESFKTIPVIPSRSDE